MWLSSPSVKGDSVLFLVWMLHKHVKFDHHSYGLSISTLAGWFIPQLGPGTRLALSHFICVFNLVFLIPGATCYWPPTPSSSSPPQIDTNRLKITQLNRRALRGEVECFSQKVISAVINTGALNHGSKLSLSLWMGLCGHGTFSYANNMLFCFTFLPRLVN